MRVITCDGSPAALAQLRTALTETLAGGSALAPIGPGDAPPHDAVAPGHVVVTTSGSTGEPKRVLLSAAALRASAGATHARLGGPGWWLLALPAQHIAGLQVLVRATLAGSECGVLDLRAGFDPAAFATAAAAAPAGTAYTSLVPTQLARLLDDPAGARALARFDAVLLGGAAASNALLTPARAAGVPVVTTYGMSETCGGCVYDGRPLDGVRVRLDDAGRIEIAGPVLAEGYLGLPADPAFRGGWFRTSDLGRIAADGSVTVLGRVDDVIITGGVNVAPAEVEDALTADPTVAAACVVGIPDAAWGQRVVAAVVPTDAASPPDADAVLTAARGRLTGAQTPKQVLVVEALPLRGVGKPDRQAVSALLRHAFG